MREIWCRVWDRNNLCYIYSDNKDYLFTLTADGGLEVWYLDQGEIYDLVFHSSPEWYVGFEDKNGVGIFEGDIMEWRAEEEWADCYDEPLKRDVVTIERFPFFWLKNEEFGYEGEDLANPLEWEIIGNIHENPELLEVERCEG